MEGAKVNVFNVLKLMKNDDDIFKLVKSINYEISFPAFFKILNELEQDDEISAAVKSRIKQYKEHVYSNFIIYFIFYVNCVRELHFNFDNDIDKNLYYMGWLLFICTSGDSPNCKSYKLLICCLRLVLQNANKQQICNVESLADLPTIKKMFNLSLLENELETIENEVLFPKIKYLLETKDLLSFNNQPMNMYDLDLSTGKNLLALNVFSLQIHFDGINNSTRNFDGSILIQGCEFHELIFKKDLVHQVMRSSIEYSPIAKDNLTSSLRSTLDREVSVNDFVQSNASSILQYVERCELIDSENEKTIRKLILFAFGKMLKKEPKLDSQDMVQKVDLMRQLTACCTQIVIFTSQNKNAKFPWVLLQYNLSALEFSKLIGPIIMSCGSILTKSVINHLTAVERKIFGMLAWCSDSPLWTEISRFDGRLPSCDDMFKPIQSSTFFINDEKAYVWCGRYTPQMRKIYILANDLLNLIFKHLKIDDSDFKCKAWTVLGLLITEFPLLIKDRNLVDIINCSIQCVSDKENYNINVSTLYKKPDIEFFEILYKNEFCKCINNKMHKIFEESPAKWHLSPMPKKDSVKLDPGTPIQTYEISPIINEIQKHNGTANFGGARKRLQETLDFHVNTSQYSKGIELIVNDRNQASKRRCTRYMVNNK